MDSDGSYPLEEPTGETMRAINKAGLDLIKEEEGLRLEAYQDQGGVWTIGWGHTGPDVHKGCVITEQQAEQLLDGDLADAEGSVNKLVIVPLTDNQFASLVSFVFNLGELHFKNSTLLQVLNQEYYDSVPSEMRRWKFVQDQATKKYMASPGMEKRREKEIALWMTSSPESSS